MCIYINYTCIPVASVVCFKDTVLKGIINEYNIFNYRKRLQFVCNGHRFDKLVKKKHKRYALVSELMLKMGEN